MYLLNFILGTFSIHSYKTPFYFAAGVGLLGAFITSFLKVFRKSESTKDAKKHIGLTTVHLENKEIDNDKNSLIVTQTCSSTFTSFTRSVKYRLPPQL